MPNTQTDPAVRHIKPLLLLLQTGTEIYLFHSGLLGSNVSSLSHVLSDTRRRTPHEVNTPPTRTAHKKTVIKHSHAFKSHFVSITCIVEDL